MIAKVRTVAQIKRLMQAAAARKREALARGLLKAGQFLQAESMKIVPVDYGNLKNSAFTRLEGAGTAKPKATVGYTANYAIYVHEDTTKAHGAVFNMLYAAELKAAKKRKKAGKPVTGPFRHSRGPNQQAKFLEAPFRRYRQQIIDIITAEIRK